MLNTPIQIHTATDAEMEPRAHREPALLTTYLIYTRALPRWAIEKVWGRLR